MRTLTTVHVVDVFLYQVVQFLLQRHDALIERDPLVIELLLRLHLALCRVITRLTRTHLVHGHQQLRPSSSQWRNNHPCADPATHGTREGRGSLCHHPPPQKKKNHDMLLKN